MNRYTQIYNGFTRDLLIKFNSDKNDLVLSPFSILVLLCMAADSTYGETRDEIIRVICKDLPYEEVRAIVKDLCEKFSEDDTLSLANALCTNEKIADSLKPEFKAMLSEDYSAEFFTGKDIVNDVNSWVKEKTNGMIDKIADDSTELISLYYGSDIKEEEANALCERISAKFSGCDVEVQYGGQPIYYYIVSAE